MNCYSACSILACLATLSQTGGICVSYQVLFAFFNSFKISFVNPSSLYNCDDEIDCIQNQGLDLVSDFVLYANSEICNSQEGSEQGAVPSIHENYDHESLLSGSSHGSPFEKATTDLAGTHDAITADGLLHNVGTGFPAGSAFDTHFDSLPLYLDSSQNTIVPVDHDKTADRYLPGQGTGSTSPPKLEAVFPQIFGDPSFQAQFNFSLFADDEELSLDDQLSRRSSQISPSIGSWGTNSPGSFAFSDDAVGSPIFPLAASNVLCTPEEESTLPERVNNEAQERMKYGDRGRKRRKKPTTPTAGRKRSRSQEEEAQTESTVIEGETEARIKRPRVKSYICPKCNEGFTRRRDLELHMGTHDLPLFECQICDREYTRRDNFRTHLNSKTHKKKVGVENQAAVAVDAAPALATSPPSSNPTSVSPYLDLTSVPTFLDTSHHPYIPQFADSRQPAINPLHRQEAISNVKAAIETLQGRLAQLEQRNC